MIIITSWIIFIFTSILNLAAISAIIDFIADDREIGYKGYIFIFVCFAIWFASGLYIFGV